MKTITITVKGNVHKVGYRKKVFEIANSLGIKGEVKNLEDGSVKIIAQQEDIRIKKFAEIINIKNTLIRVDEVSVEPLVTDKVYNDFRKIVKPKETDERIDEAIGHFKTLIELTKYGVEENKKGFRDLSDKQSQMLDKQDHMSGKLDLIHNDLSVNLKSFHQDTINRFDVVDKKYGMIAQNRSKIFSEMREERVESRKSMEKLIGAVLKVAGKK